MGNRKSVHQKRSKSRSKSAKKHKKSVKRRGDSLESDEKEDYWDRMSKPVDHTETKKRILREEKEKREMNLTRNSSKKKLPKKRTGS